MKAVSKGIIIFLCLNAVEPRWRPITQPKERYSVTIFPHKMDKNQLAQLKIPNKIFCAQMEKQTAGIFILMPWWYNYCQDLKEERTKQYKSSNVLYKPIYKTILDHVQWHQRHKREGARRNNIIWLRKRH